MLLNQDPLAKACLDTFWDTILRSGEYQPTVADPNVMIIHNVIYKLKYIFQKSFEINQQLQRSIDHFKDESDQIKDYFDYVASFLASGKLLADMARYFLSSKKVGDPTQDMYLYPDSKLDLRTPTLDRLVFPGENYDLYPRFEEVNS